MNLISGIGIFVYPLGFCAILAVFIFFERFLSLRKKYIFPKDFEKMLSQGKSFPVGSKTVMERITQFSKNSKPAPKALKAYAELEVSAMERGLFILNLIVNIAPMLGLLGTVVGLVRVFANISPETGMPESESFVQGIALALGTTMIGLAIAIPAQVASSFLSRKIDVYLAKINIGIERLIDLSE